MVLLRQVTLHDAKALSDCINWTFDEQTTPDSVAARIIDTNHHIWVAYDQNELVGFADAFATMDKSGNIRFELDLLGVMPQARHRGVGRELVQTMIQASKTTMADYIRALVAIDNLPMHKVLQAQGFAHHPEITHLYITMSPENDLKGSQSLTQTHQIHVKTLTYTGIWLEIPLDELAIPVARRTMQQGDLVGILVPTGDSASRRLVLKASFDLIGQYQWWTHPIM